MHRVDNKWLHAYEAFATSSTKYNLYYRNFTFIGYATIIWLSQNELFFQFTVNLI